MYILVCERVDGKLPEVTLYDAEDLTLAQYTADAARAGEYSRVTLYTECVAHGVEPGAPVCNKCEREFEQHQMEADEAYYPELGEHEWEPTDSQGHEMECVRCGALWRFELGGELPRQGDQDCEMCGPPDDCEGCPRAPRQ